METSKWKFFELQNLFTIYASKDSNLLDSEKGSTPYISSTRENNGISSFIDSDPIHEKNTLTLARNGSVGATFYHSYSYSASPDDIRVLKPNFPINQYIAMFLATLIEKEKYRYAYGRKFGSKRIETTEIKLPILPDNSPDWKWIENYVKNTLIPQLPHTAQEIFSDIFIHKSVSDKKLTLDTKSWKCFRYGDIFSIEKGYYNKKPDETEGGNMIFIGATDSNNGITSYHDEDDVEKFYEGNSITVSNDGSIGNAFYQENVFTCSHSVNILRPQIGNWNEYSALFICTLIEKEKYRWAYGRKWRPSRMPDSTIKLPITPSGSPDWQWMEEYIKGLPYSSAF